PLVAAGLTFYAVVGLIPMLAIGIRIGAAVLGRAAVLDTADRLAEFVPGTLGVDAAVRQLGAGAASASWGSVAVAVVPASLYAEGAVRALERFSVAPERRSRTLRGRFLTIPLMLIAACAIVLGATVLRPLLEDPFGTGTGPRLLGILVAFCIIWAGATGVLCLIYRLFAATAIGAGPLLLSSAAAGSWLAGQTLGYVLSIRLLGRLDAAYGGASWAGAVAAAAFLLYLNHVVVLLGYGLALFLHEEHALRRPCSHRRQWRISQGNVATAATPLDCAEDGPRRTKPGSA
ncbi:MAG: putative glycosyl transferase, partial [Pseudonocardiales bacterium]|nr:putative glycosyl transferase [Pseudonocardiales bacterium]